MRNLLLTFILFPLAVLAQGNFTGKKVLLEKFASKSIGARTITVWLPENYSESEKYSVLYMHDGQMLFDSSNTWNKQEWHADETAQKLISGKKVRKFIIVGIESIPESRHFNYFPQKPFEMLTKKQQDSLYSLERNGATMFRGKVNSDDYLKFIVTELKPVIDSGFSVLTNRENTFIAGSSMGGLISLYAICEYPEVFGGAACISTHWPGIYDSPKNPVPEVFLRYMQQKLPDPRTHKIYFDLGDQTLDSAYKPYQDMADTVMQEKGFSKASWITKHFPGADHSEKSWAERLDVPLLFLLGK